MDFDFDHNSLQIICLEIQNNDELRLKVAENMQKHGGSFVQALGKCLILADRQNRYKLTDAFMTYILEYQPKKWPKLPEETEE